MVRKTWTDCDRSVNEKVFVDPVSFYRVGRVFLRFFVSRQLKVILLVLGKVGPLDLTCH